FCQLRVAQVVLAHCAPQLRIGWKLLCHLHVAQERMACRASQ
ncbi:hypothetical protein A2U01_0099628, partial [Trifolium medium]|nr:hypothetical protein [Trifolium medium]